MTASQGSHHNVGMLAFDSLPNLAPHALAIIVGLLVTFWIWMRVKILRDRLALRGPGDAEPDASPLMKRLAASPKTTPALALLAVGLIVLLAVLGLSPAS